MIGIGWMILRAGNANVELSIKNPMIILRPVQYIREKFLRTFGTIRRRVRSGKPLRTDLTNNP